MPDEPKSENFRLFVALRIPDEVKTGIARAQAELRCKTSAGSVRWTSPDQFHLTLKFLGGVAAARVEDLTAALRAACQGFGPLQLRAETIGFFPNARAPRVLWAGITDPDQSLSRLQKAIEAATAPFNAEPAEGRFLGHITLARIKGARRSEREALKGLVEPVAEQVFGQWTAPEVELIRSQLSSTGAKHSTLARAALVPHS